MLTGAGRCWAIRSRRSAGTVREEQLCIGGFEEARLNAAIEEMQEAVVVAVDVEDADGFLMEAELCR